MENNNYFNKQFYSYLVSYVVASWGVIQFLDWVCKRYDFSSLWTDVLGIILITLLPSAILISWLRSNANNVFSKKNIFFLVNGLITIGLCGLFIFMNKNNSTTKEITVLDEHNNETKVEVSKQEYIRSIVFAPFETSKENAWLSYGFPSMLAVDIRQDKRISIFSPASIIKDLKKMNYEENGGLIQNMKLGITNRYLSNYVLSGKVNKINEKEYAYSIDLFDRVKANSVYTNEGITSDLLLTIDSLTNRVEDYIYEYDLGIEREASTNLTIPEMYSSDLAALEYYFKGVIEINKGNLPGIIAYLRKAIEIDPKFADAYRLKAYYLYRNGENPEALQDISKSLELSKAVSVQQQFHIKDAYYKLKFETDKRAKLLQMWTQLHPESRVPFNRLITQAESSRNIDEAINIAKKAIDAGHKDFFILKLAMLLAKVERADEAEKYLNLYKETYPDDAESLLRVSEVYKDLGDHEKSCNYYNEYYTLNPLDLEIHKKLSDCYFNQGDFLKAEKELQSTWALAKNLNDSIVISTNLESYYYSMGQMDKCLELLYERWNFSKRLYTPFNFTFLKTDAYSRMYHIGAGESEKLLSYMKDGQKLLDENQATYGFISFLEFYFIQEDGEGFNRVYNENKDIMESMMASTEMYDALKGYSYKFNGEYEKAITVLEKVMENSSDRIAEMHLYDCYRLNGQCDKSIKGYEKLLKKYPYEGYYLLPYAKCLYDLEKVDEAKKVLEKLLTIYKNADDDFDKKKETIALMDKINLIN